MSKKKRKIYPFLYVVMVVVFLAGAWFGLLLLPDGPDSGFWGHNGRARPAPQVFEEGEITLQEGVEILTRHQGKDCRLNLQDLPAGFDSFNFAGASREDVLSLLNSDADWELAVFEPQRLVLEYTGKLCSHCRDLHYVGLYQGKIAIYSGTPPHGVLVEITDYEVSEIYREDLERGIPFESEAEKKSILESYTT